MMLRLIGVAGGITEHLLRLVLLAWRKALAEGGLADFGGKHDLLRHDIFRRAGFFISAVRLPHAACSFVHAPQSRRNVVPASSLVEPFGLAFLEVVII